MVAATTNGLCHVAGVPRGPVFSVDESEVLELLNEAIFAQLDDPVLASAATLVTVCSERRSPGNGAARHLAGRYPTHDAPCSVSADHPEYERTSHRRDGASRRSPSGPTTSRRCALANLGNATFVMVRFCLDPDKRRLFGQYTFPCRDRLKRRQFCRAPVEQDEEDVLCKKLDGGRDERRRPRAHEKAVAELTAGIMAPMLMHGPAKSWKTGRS